MRIGGYGSAAVFVLEIVCAAYTYANACVCLLWCWVLFVSHLYILKSKLLSVVSFGPIFFLVLTVIRCHAGNEVSESFNSNRRISHYSYQHQ